MSPNTISSEWSRPEGIDESSEVDIGSYIRQWFAVLRRRKGLIVSVALIGLVLTYIIVENLTPYYTATSQVMIEAGSRNVIDFDAVMAGVGSNDTAVSSEAEVLRSRSLMNRVMERLELRNDPEFNPLLRGDQKSILSLDAWIPQEWLQALGLRRAPNVSLSEEDLATRERALVIDILLSRLTIEPIPGTTVIDILFRSESAAKAASIANTIAELYILEQLEAKFEATAQANEWLSGRLNELRQDVVEAEAAVAAYRVQGNLGDSNSQSLIEQQLTQANTQLTEARATRAAAQANYNQVQTLLQNEGVSSAAQVLANPLIISLREREADAKRTLADLSTRYGNKHPDIINAQAEIADLQATIASEVSKIVQNLSNEVAVARAREMSFEQSVAELNDRFNLERGAEVELRELEREADATRLLYDTMLARFKEVSEQDEIQQPDARVISDADVPRSPSDPKKTLILVAAGVAFVGLGMGLAFLLEHLNSGFRSLEQLTRQTGLAALVEVPLLRRSSRKSPRTEVLKHPTSAFSEAVRSVQTALALSNVDNPPKVISIVSSVPEEGKSALSLTLAHMMAKGGHRVLLVDCDLRRPQLHRPLGAKRGPGLTELLIGSHALQDVVLVDESSGLRVLPAGSEAPNPHDLLQSARMRELIERMRDEYDLVLLDTPALLAVADGLVVANIADTTLMLVRWEKTPREVVQTALRSLRSAEARMAGVVLTQVDQRKQARYGYSSYGYYYGRYKSYYADS